MPDEQSRLELVRRHYEAYNAHDIEAQVETLDRAIEIMAIDETGVVAEHWQGLDQARDFFVGIRAMVADSRAEIRVMRADGADVLVELTLAGTLRRTGEPGAIEALHRHSFSGERIAKIRTHRPNWRPDSG